MSDLDTAIVRATYATAATYRQSPRPDRVADFDAWLDRERAEARREGQAEAWEQGVRSAQREAKRELACERPRPLINPYETKDDRHVDQ